MPRLVWCAVLALAPLLLAQQAPTFKAGTRLVQVDVVVRDKKGPISGLAKDDFVLLDQGKPRDIALFRTSESVREQARKSTGPLPPGVISNRVDTRGEPIVGATAVLYDQLNRSFDNQEYARTEMLTFLKTLGPSQRLAVYALNQSSLTVLQDFAGNTGKMSQQLASWSPGLDTLTTTGPRDRLSGLQSQVYNGIKDEITVEAVRAIVRHFAGVPGRRNLVWMSDVPRLWWDSKNHQHVNRDAATVRAEDESLKIQAMLREANIALYPVLVRGVPPTGALDGSAFGRRAGRGPAGRAVARMEEVQDFGATTGGEGFTDAAALGDALRTAESDAATSYTLGFYPAEEVLDGKLHTLTIRLSEKHGRSMEVRYRPEYLATATAEAVAVPASQLSSAPDLAKDLLDNPLNATAIGVQALASSIPNRPGAYQVDVLVDLNDIHLDRRDNHWVGAFDTAVRFEARSSSQPPVQTNTLDIPDDQLKARLQAGFLMREIVNAGGVAGELRIVVRDRATGLSGSIRVPLATK